MKVDPEREVALVATVGAAADETVVGSGRCFIAGQSDGSRTGEVAFIVEEDYQGLGLAGRLLARFIEIARMRRFAALEADVLAENKAMLAVFARSGLPMRKRRDGGTVHVTLSLQDEKV
jgi:GNAT superfamily N-acetyltransferase